MSSRSKRRVIASNRTRSIDDSVSSQLKEATPRSMTSDNTEKKVRNYEAERKDIAQMRLGNSQNKRIKVPTLNLASVV